MIGTRRRLTGAGGRLEDRLLAVLCRPHPADLVEVLLARRSRLLTAAVPLWFAALSGDISLSNPASGGSSFVRPLAAALSTPPEELAALARDERHPVKETAHFRFHVQDSSIPPQLLNRFASDQEVLFERVRNFLGTGPAPDGPHVFKKIDYVLYPSLEVKGLATGNAQFAHADHKSHAVYSVLNGWIDSDGGRSAAVLILRDRIGKPVTRALEIGLGIYLSRPLQKRGYAYWAARLHLSGNTPDLGDLFEESRLALESYLVTEPTAGVLVAYLIESWGKEKFLSRYAGWRPTLRDLSEITPGWRAHLDDISRRFAEQIEMDRRGFPTPPIFQRGFCHAHEGYQILNGYLSSKSDAALRKLAEMRANAVSITPFTYMRDPASPAPFPLPTRAGEENDESIIHAAHTIKQLGMAVMLKPHIWLWRSWPGEIQMANELEWDLFFNYYYRWIRHYAILAEIYRMEILCIGVELSAATVGREKPWMQMAQKLRGLYSGRLTYAANWGAELERCTLWNSFDYIGVNCYYPLSVRDDATLEDLKEGAELFMRKIAAVSRTYRKPVLLTEIGFTSTKSPWKNPHEPARQKAVQLGDQALCYEAVFQAIEGKAWCEGVYWWKWPSFLEYGGPTDAGFTPNNKPAEDVVRKWFGAAR